MTVDNIYIHFTSWFIHCSTQIVCQSILCSHFPIGKPPLPYLLFIFWNMEAADFILYKFLGVIPVEQQVTPHESENILLWLWYPPPSSLKASWRGTSTAAPQISQTYGRGWWRCDVYHHYLSWCLEDLLCALRLWTNKYQLMNCDPPLGVLNFFCGYHFNDNCMTIPETSYLTIVLGIIPIYWCYPFSHNYIPHPSQFFEVLHLQVWFLPPLISGPFHGSFCGVWGLYGVVIIKICMEGGASVQLYLDLREKN